MKMDVADLPLLLVANPISADLQLAGFLGSLHILVHYGDNKPDCVGLLALVECED